MSKVLQRWAEDPRSRSRLPARPQPQRPGTAQQVGQPGDAEEDHQQDSLDGDRTQEEGIATRVDPPVNPELASLTEQELKLLARIAEGLTNRQIGEQMFLGEKTVKNYVSSILSKLGLERRTRAAVLASNCWTPGATQVDERADEERRLCLVAWRLDALGRGDSFTRDQWSQTRDFRPSREDVWRS